MEDGGGLSRHISDLENEGWVDRLGSLRCGDTGEVTLVLEAVSLTNMLP